MVVFIGTHCLRPFRETKITGDEPVSVENTFDDSSVDYIGSPHVGVHGIRIFT